MKQVIIIGASSGLGEGMAREFARRGYGVAITGRRLERLQHLREELLKITDQVFLKVLDITDFASVEPALQSLRQEMGSVDTVVVSSGVGPTLAVGSDDFTLVKQTVDTNITGTVVCFDAAIRMFKDQGFGHLVGVSSVAAIRGLPLSGIYSASKAAVSRYLESAQAELFKTNIKVTDLCPGYIDTDMNAHLEKRPFLISAERGVTIMVDKIEARKGFSYIPVWPWSLVAKLLRVLPVRLLAR